MRWQFAIVWCKVCRKHRIIFKQKTQMLLKQPLVHPPTFHLAWCPLSSRNHLKQCRPSLGPNPPLVFYQIYKWRGTTSAWQQWMIIVYYMKLTPLLSIFYVYFGGPFCNCAYLSNILIVFSKVHTREKQYLSLMYTMHVDASKNTPSYTHVGSYMAWRPPPCCRQEREKVFLWKQTLFGESI